MQEQGLGVRGCGQREGQPQAALWSTVSKLNKGHDVVLRHGKGAREEGLGATWWRNTWGMMN